jgi:glycosyltransferase involved in cell wall biosynthesis
METYARELYRELGNQKSEFTFVGLASSEGYQLDNSWFPGDVVDSRISGENRFAWARGELFGVGKWAARLGADLIHSPATLGPFKTRIPVVITMHDMLYFSHPEYMSTPLYTEPVKWMEKRAAANASRIVTDSESSAREILKYLSVEPGRLEVIPLAGTVDAKTVTASAPRRDDLIIAVGNRRPHKNFASLIRALSLVDPAVRPHLVITGSRGDDPLTPIVQEHGLADWVDLRSWVSPEELETLYSTASALAMPSFEDGFCLPALEAMLVGLPVMLSDIPVYREVGGDAALYFDPTNIHSIADAMTKVATSSDLRSQLTRDGYVQTAKFTWPKVATSMLEAFRVALQNPRS